MAQVRSRENTFKVDLANFPKRPSIEELQKFVLVNLGLTVGQVKRFQVNHAQNCVHVKCSELKVAQDTVATHDGKHVLEINKTKVTVRLVMEDGGVEVKIHDLSENVTNEDIVAFLRHYGDVLSIREVPWGEGFPLRGMSSGIRVAKMILRRHIKSFATILGESTLISYRGQPMTCRHCTLTQHIGMSCVENKKLLGQKADLNARLKNASGSPSTSYASVLTSVAPATNTNTLMPEFSGTVLGPGIPKRPPPIVPESMEGSTSVSGDGSSSAQTDVAEHSVGLKTSGDGTSADVPNNLDRVAELSAGSAPAASGGSTSIESERSNESVRTDVPIMVANGSSEMLSPLPPAAAAAGGDNEAEGMEIENPSAAEDAVELNSQQTREKQPPHDEEDAEMSTFSDATSSAMVSSFKSPFPVPDPDLKNAHSLSSISGSESDIGETTEYTVVEKRRRPGRPKKSKTQ